MNLPTSLPSACPSSSSAPVEPLKEDAVVSKAFSVERHERISVEGIEGLALTEIANIKPVVFPALE